MKPEDFSWQDWNGVELSPKQRQQMIAQLLEHVESTGQKAMFSICGDTAIFYFEKEGLFECTLRRCAKFEGPMHVGLPPADDKDEN